MTKLASGTGTSVSTSAANVTTVAISGLAAVDTLFVRVTGSSETQATGKILLYNTTDSLTVADCTATAVVASGTGFISTTYISQDQSANTSIWAVTNSINPAGLGTGGITSSGAGTNSMFANALGLTTAWTGSWTLALRHNGVTSGGTFHWNWAVYKIAG